MRELFERISERVARRAGQPVAFMLALAVIALWVLSGPVFHWSDTWQLVINTGTTIVTFLMVFLIQRSQNKDALAIQLKLNELVAAMQGASNRLIDVESLEEQDLKVLHQHFQRLVEMAKKDEDLGRSHSVDEAEQRHSLKQKARQKTGRTSA